MTLDIIDGSHKNVSFQNSYWEYGPRLVNTFISTQWNHNNVHVYKYA